MDRKSPSCDGDPRRFDLVAESDPEQLRAARAFAAAEAAARGAKAVDDVTLVAAELLANAVQHGAPPFWVTVSGAGARIRLEVGDASSQPPVRPAPSVTNMTGRGLALVGALATRWGIGVGDGNGKVVWAEFEPSAWDDPGPDFDVDSLLSDWSNRLAEVATEPQFTVVLGDVPTDLLIEAKSHIDNLVREFSLAETAAKLGDEVPAHLAEIIQTVVHGFAQARDAIKRQALAAARRRDARTNLVLSLPLSAADAGEAYLRALDEADSYARAARLLTLETPPAHRLFRNWYVDAVVRGIRDSAAGRSRQPVVPFETRMLEELHRLTALQQITDRAARLQRVAAALASARVPEDVAGVVLSEGVAALGAAGGGLLVPAEDGIHVAVTGVVGYGDELVGALREERIDAPLPGAIALRSGTPVWLESRDERDRQFPALRGLEAGTVSMCAVPLLAGGRVLGALRFSFTSRRLFDDDEREFVLALASQTSQTLLRTELDAAEREAALGLQRALLPAQIAPIEGWGVAAHYSAAGQHEAGGDFYDVLPVGDGRVVAVVGDVMGRGVAAAAAMAQIRTMILAYAVEDPEPVAVLSRVDRFFQALDHAQLVTVMYMLIETATGAVTLCTAGHLAPVLVEPRQSRLVDVPIGPPLGIGAGPRSTTSVQVPSNCGLIAFTDGLVERRDQDIDVGIARLLAAAHKGDRAASAHALLRRALGSAPDLSEQDDDVTVLAMYRY